MVLPVNFGNKRRMERAVTLLPHPEFADNAKYFATLYLKADAAQNAGNPFFAIKMRLKISDI
ncbi:hypothetical protein ACVWZZ_004514 [Bradyrhizobium sp. LM6.10]